MKQFVKTIICCALIVICMGCNIKESEKNKEVEMTTEHVTQEKQSQEEHPVLSDESLICLEGALSSNDNKKYAGYIAKYLYLSEIAVDTIIRANVVEKPDDKDRIFIEVEDSQNRIYVVVVSEKYDLIGIKENAIDGQWIFIVTQD